MVMRKKRRANHNASVSGQSLAVGMWVTFRAELMPGRNAIERTFEVARVLRNQRVELDQLAGQHSFSEFERISKNGKLSTHISTEDLIESKKDQ
jgi:hypothetical protein